MVERVTLECDLPDCPTPDKGVERVLVSVGKKRYEIDLCTNDRESLMDVLRHARPLKAAPQRRGIQVTDPADVPR